MVDQADKEWVRVGQWGSSMHIRAGLCEHDEETEPDYVGAVQLDMCPAFWEALESCLDRVDALKGRGVDPGARVILTEPLAKALHKALTMALGGNTL